MLQFLPESSRNGSANAFDGLVHPHHIAGAPKLGGDHRMCQQDLQGSGTLWRAQTASIFFTFCMMCSGAGA